MPILVNLKIKNTKLITKGFTDQHLMVKNIYIKILEWAVEIMFKQYKIFIKNKKDNKLIQKKWKK
jgi:hypothetical protein